MKSLLTNGYIVRVISINNSKFFQLDINRTWEEGAFYAWTFEGSQIYTIIGAFALIIVAFSLAMYQIWPKSLRVVSWYLMILMSFLLAVLLIISIIRLILFIVTYFLKPPGIWLFPRLFEDVSIIESFTPLWAWHRP